MSRRPLLRSTVLALACLFAKGARAEVKPLRLAVLDFKPAATAPDLSPLGAGLQAMLTTDLGQVAAFVLLERARINDILAEQKLQQSGLVDKETAVKIGALLGASHLLIGTFTVHGGRMRLDAGLLAVATNEYVLQEKIEGAETAFFELEGALVKKIVTSVSVRLNRKERAELAKPQTKDWEAFQSFSKGIAEFDAKKTELAIASMKAAVARDASFALAAQLLATYEAAAAKAPEVPKAGSCQQNPLTTPSCQSPDSVEPPRAPTIFTGDGKRPYSIIVRQGGTEAPCVTPCQLQLPKGPFEVEVLSPGHYKQKLDAPGGPVAIEVSHLNKTNIIIGGVLAGLTIAMVGATAGMHELNASTNNAQQYWEVPLTLATGMAFPAVYYLLQMGKNKAKVATR